MVELAALLLNASKCDVEVLQQLPATFSETLSVYMNIKKVSKNQLAESSLLSPRSIQNFRTGKGRKPSRKSVIALGIGLRLSLLQVENLLFKAGYVFKHTEEDAFYRRLLSVSHLYTIHDCNAMLLLAGFDVLTLER